MTGSPLVTVVMNCYNGEKYLREAISSVLRQTYDKLEIVFWDNQSTDRSAEIFRSYEDPRLRYFYAPTHTLLYEARNEAIAHARGKLVAFLDVDDWWTPEKLERQVPLFADPEVGVACADYWIESERKGKRWRALKHPVPRGWVLDDLLKYYFVGLPTLVVRKRALASLDRLCDPRFHIMGDYDLVMRLAAEWKVECIEEPLAHYRLHGSNESAKHRRRLIDEMELWLGEVQGEKPIGTSPSFHGMEAQLAYMKGVYELLQDRRRRAFSIARRLPWSRLKLRLTLALLLPLCIVRRLPN